MTHSLILRPARVLLPSGLVSNMEVLIREDRIQCIGSPLLCPEAEILPLPEATLIPALVDVHVQGTLGADVWEDSPDSIQRLSGHLTRFGVGAYLGTTVYDKPAIQRLVQACETDLPGARLLGIHLEGPFISPKKLGAIPLAATESPSARRAEEIVAECKGHLKMMTVAPELPNAREIIRCLLDHNVVVSIGHSNASFEEARQSFDWGITHATHLFNAMPSIHHREPGLALACLLDERVSVQVIPDGIHLHPAMVDAIFRLKGIEGVALITDAVKPAGLPDGIYASGGHGVQVTVKDGQVRLPNGTLAGSSLTMDRALKLAMAFAHLSLEEAVHSASVTPQKCLGLPAHLGLTSGSVADVVALSPEGTVKLCLVKGKSCFQSE